MDQPASSLNEAKNKLGVMILVEPARGKYMTLDKGLLPNVFKKMFLRTNQVHSYITGNSNTFYLFPTRTNMTFWYKISGS